MHDVLRRLGPRNADAERATRALLDRLPGVDWREVHALADQASGRNGDAVLEAALRAVYDWLDAQVCRRAAHATSSGLVPFAEAWRTVAAKAREAEAYNLDRRSLVVAIFVALSAAVRVAG